MWENVPGAFSSNEKEDFRLVLEELCKIKDESANVPQPSIGGKGKWKKAGHILGRDYSLAWRVLDAQFWGVPQRRRRIFLVADFRGESAAEILFKRDGLSRSFAESRQAWKGLAADTTFGTNQSGKCFDARGNGNGDISPTIIGDHNNRITDYSAVVVYDGENITNKTNTSNPKVNGKCHTIGASGSGRIYACLGVDLYNQATTGNKTRTIKTPLGGDDLPVVVVGVDTYNQTLTYDKAKTLVAGHQDADGVPCVAMNLTQDPIPNNKVFPCLSTGNPITGQANLAVCYTLDATSSNSMKSDNPNSGFHETNIHRTLDTLCNNPTCNQGGTVICMATQQGGAEIAENLCPTITVAAGMSGNNQPILCAELGQAARTGGHIYENICGTLRANPGDNQTTLVYANKVIGSLCARDYKGVGNQYINEGKIICYCATDKTFFSVAQDKSPTMKQRDYKTPNYVCFPLPNHWIVRRVVPIECARLQGMPDWWCKDIPHSDAAEYKMWGNGMALPCVMYVMEGIAIQLQKEILSKLEVNS